MEDGKFEIERGTIERGTKKARGSVSKDYERGTYTGKMVNGKRTGHGRMDYYKENNIMNIRHEHVYVGNWKNDLKSGFGKMTYYGWGDGPGTEYSYEGQWKLNNRDGHGKEINKFGTFVGEWKRGISGDLAREPIGNIEPLDRNNLNEISFNDLVLKEVYLLFEKETKNKTKVRYIGDFETDYDLDGDESGKMLMTLGNNDEMLEFHDTDFEQNGKFSIFEIRLKKILRTKNNGKMPDDVFFKTLDYLEHGGSKKKLQKKTMKKKTMKKKTMKKK
jgi:hypothetical protein